MMGPDRVVRVATLEGPMSRAVVVGLILLLGACGGPEESHDRSFAASASPAPSSSAAEAFVFETPPPLFQEEDIFPCTECHDEDWETNPERRELTMMHEDIVLEHDAANRWCLDCHDTDNRDMLRLANGTLVPFDKSYRLCGQCHGDKFRDWRAGEHGRRTGHWNGEKKYRLCVTCHQAHAPSFKPLEPMPAPRRPEAIQKEVSR